MINKGIHPPYVIFYSQSIRFNCHAGMLSVNNAIKLLDTVERNQGEITASQELSILDNLQNFFSHAAILSKFFWPSKYGKNNEHSIRATHLKQLFNVSDSSSLRDKKLRNQLEHFDENLDRYLSKVPLVGTIFPSYVGFEKEDNGVPIHYFRAYFIDTGMFEVLGEKHEVQTLVDELTYIYKQFSST